MRGGVVVLNFFALAWSWLAITGANLSPAWMAVPLAVTVALLLWARMPRHAPDPSIDRSHVGRLVGIWSAVEGVAMFVVANILINIGLRDAIAPAMAIVVGLHFVPLARGFPVPLYYGAAAVMVAIGIVALLLPGSERLMFTGAACAVALWATCALLVTPLGAIRPRAGASAGA